MINEYFLSDASKQNQPSYSMNPEYTLFYNYIEKDIRPNLRDY